MRSQEAANVRVRKWLPAVAAVAILAVGGCEKKKGDRVESDLCWAAHEGDLQEVQSQLARGVSVHATDYHGRTLLHYAAARGNAGIVELLIARGADVNARNKSGATPLANALAHGHVVVAKRLIATSAERVVLRGLAVGANSDGMPLLHEAVGVPKWVPPVRRGADVVVVDPDDDGGHRGEEWVELLLENGVDLEERDEKGNTALQAAILAGKEGSALLLIAHGADVQAKNQIGSTALHYAASDGRKELVSLLLTKGAEVNTRDNDSDTALHSAALHGHRQVVEVLLAHGADASIRNSRNRTPLDEAARRGHTDIVQLLTPKSGETQR